MRCPCQTINPDMTLNDKSKTTATCVSGERREGRVAGSRGGPIAFSEIPPARELLDVPVALFGVSPRSWCGRFHSPFRAPGRVQPARRRDADESGRDDRAPHLQMYRSGLDYFPLSGSRS